MVIERCERQSGSLSTDTPIAQTIVVIFSPVVYAACELIHLYPVYELLLDVQYECMPGSLTAGISYSNRVDFGLLKRRRSIQSRTKYRAIDVELPWFQYAKSIHLDIRTL